MFVNNLLCRLKKSWVPFEEKKRFRCLSDLLCVFGFFGKQIYGKISLLFFSSFFFTSVLLDFTFSSQLLLSHSLFLLSRFGGGGGRFCRLWFEPSVVFSSLSTIRLLENE